METIFISIITFIAGAGIAFALFKSMEKKKASGIVKEAEKEAESIKKDKILQAKEKFLELKTEHEKVINKRESKLNDRFNQLKDKESKANKGLQENNRKSKELDKLREDLNQKLELNERKAEELGKMHRKQVEQLEVISGLTPEEAKEQLLVALKDEAKTEAAAFIQSTMEEARLTANTEAKKVVIQSILFE